MKTRFCAIFTALTLCAMVGTTAFAYTVEDVSFNDFVAPDSELEKVVEVVKQELATPSSWAANEVNHAITLGLVPNELQGVYVKAITRAEFCALATQMYETVKDKEITEYVMFNDTTDFNVLKMAGLGVVNGVGNNEFAPDLPLTREQAATILARLATALGAPLANHAPTFADNQLCAGWAQDAVGMVQGAGIMGGVGNNLFDPQGSYTREQSILTILRLYNNYSQMSEMGKGG